jgi:hypothetical protein
MLRNRPWPVLLVRREATVSSLGMMRFSSHITAFFSTL